MGFERLGPGGEKEPGFTAYRCGEKFVFGKQYGLPGKKGTFGGRRGKPFAAEVAAQSGGESFQSRLSVKQNTGGAGEFLGDGFVRRDLGEVPCPARGKPTVFRVLRNA